MEVGIGDLEFLVDVLDELGHGFAHRNIVGSVHFLDADPERNLTVAARLASRIAQPVLDAGDIAQVDIGVVDPLPAALGDEEIAHLLGRERLTHGADVELIFAILQVAGGGLVVLHLERVADVENGQLAFEEFVVIDPDAQVPLRPAAEDDVADARNDEELVAQMEIDIGEHLLERPLAGGDGEPHDGLVVGVHLGDGGGQNVAGELHRAELGIGFLERCVDVLAGVEGQLHIGLTLAHVRLDILDALDGNDGFLDGIDDLCFHHLRRSADPRGVDGEDGRRGFGQLADAQMEKADDPEEHERAHQHPGKNRAADGEIGESHGEGLGI